MAARKKKREEYKPRRVAVKPFPSPSTVTLKNPQKFGEMFFRCIQMLEGAGEYATMDVSPEQRVFKFLDEHHGATSSEIAEGTGLSEVTVSNFLGNLGERTVQVLSGDKRYYYNDQEYAWKNERKNIGNYEKQIIDYIREHEYATLSDIETGIALPPGFDIESAIRRFVRAGGISEVYRDSDYRYNPLVSMAHETTCLDSILSHPHVQGSPVYIHVGRESYGGNNESLRELVETGEGLPRTYTTQNNDYATQGCDISLFDAVMLFFLNNPEATPEIDFCSIRDGKQHVKINCLSHVLELQNLSAYRDGSMTRARNIPTMDTVIDIVNRGAKCKLPNMGGYGSFSGKTIGSCMEALLDSEMYKFGNTVGNSSDLFTRSPFVSVMDKYDWSIIGSKGVPAIQMILDGEEGNSHRDRARNFLISLMVTAKNDQSISQSIIGILSKEYNFTAVDFVKLGGKTSNQYGTTKFPLPVPMRTTAVDYAIETGSSVSLVTGIMSNAKMFSSEPMCKYNGSYDTCISKLLNKLMPRAEGGNWYSQYDIKTMNNYMQYADLEDIGKATLEGDCSQYSSDKEHPDTCIDFMISNSSANPTIKTVLNSVLTSYPPNDLTCTIKENGVSRTTNCLDKIISLDSQAMQGTVMSSGILLDRPDCTDSDGNHITCIDKLAQRHEMWLYLTTRRNQLDSLRNIAEVQYNSEKDPDKKKIYSDLYSKCGRDRETISTIMNNLKVATGNENWGDIMSEYDMGNVKMHPLGKDYAGVRSVIEEELQQIETYGKDFPEIGGTQQRVNYLRELLKSVSSPTPQREVQIAPRLFKLYDASKEIAAFANSGYALTNTGIFYLYDLDRARASPSLNMFECRDSKTGKTISCMQKAIDVAKEVNADRYTNINQKSTLYNVYSMKDVMKPGLCQTETGEKMACIEYAAKNLGFSGGKEGYVALLARKDFKNLAKAPFTAKDGTVSTLGAEVCKNVKLTDLANYLTKSRGRDDVTNGNACLTGMALDLYSQCKCPDARTPLERRQCVDKVCFDAYVGDNPTATAEDGWYYEYINSPDLQMRSYRYNGQDDAFGISGVYNVAFKPSAYNVTDTERFNYSEVVKNDILPVLRRMEGLQVGKYEGRSGVKITAIGITPPVGNEEDYIVNIVFEGTNANKEPETWQKPIPVSDIFLRGGLLNREDARAHVVKYRRVEEAIEKIATRRKGGSGESTLKVVLSNRPADFLRGSTCQNWSSCMNIPGGAYNGTMFSHMALGGYLAYIASDELSPNWLGRMAIDPGMDLPEEPNNAFALYPVYGLTTYKHLLTDAVKDILYSAGYNHSDAMKNGHDPTEYIYVHRLGGQKSHKTRISQLWREIRKDALQKCLQKVANGETITIVNSRKNADGATNTEFVITPDEGHKCEMVGKTLNDGGFRPTDMARAGLVGKDLIKSLKLMRNPSTYHDGGMDWIITEDMINKIREKINVEFKSPLSVTSTGSVSA